LLGAPSDNRSDDIPSLEPFEHGRLFGGKQQARIPWMHRVERLFVGIQDENLGHGFIAPLRASGFPGNGGLDKVIRRHILKALP